MTPYKRKGKNVHFIKVPTRAGAWIERSTGKRDRKVAKKMQEMVSALGSEGKGAWDLLETVTVRPARWSLLELYEQWIATPVTRHDPETGEPIEPSVEDRIRHVRAQLQEHNLRTLLADWHKVLLGPSGGKKKKISKDTADHYRSAVRLFFAHVLELEEDDDATPVLVGRLTERELRVWIEEMDEVEPGTVRKRGIGMRRFTEWLEGRGVITLNPMAKVALPAQGKPRDHHLTTEEAKKLADAQPGLYRIFAALLAGTGIEVSVALKLRRRDVDEEAREIRAPGTKTYSRDRVVRVAEWAWTYLEPLLKGKHPDALLFDGIPHRWAARDAHADAVTALAETMPILLEQGGYTMRDHRHTYAVRAVRAGTPAELVARQLGHVNAVLVHKVYGRFAPTQRERDHWERIAAARDEAARQQSTGR